MPAKLRRAIFGQAGIKACDVQLCTAKPLLLCSVQTHCAAQGSACSEVADAWRGRASKASISSKRYQRTRESKHLGRGKRPSFTNSSNFVLEIPMNWAASSRDSPMGSKQGRARRCWGCICKTVFEHVAILGENLLPQNPRLGPRRAALFFCTVITDRPKNR